MDREEAKDVCNGFGHPHIKDDEGNVKATFARTNRDTVEKIEGLSDDELLESIKSTVFMLKDAGTVSISSLQREQLYYLELEERGLMDEFESYMDHEEKIRETTKEKLDYLNDEELITRTIELQELHKTIREQEDDENLESKLIEYHFQEILRRDLYHHYLSAKMNEEEDD